MLLTQEFEKLKNRMEHAKRFRIINKCIAETNAFHLSDNPWPCGTNTKRKGILEKDMTTKGRNKTMKHIKHIFFPNRLLSNKEKQI